MRTTLVFIAGMVTSVAILVGIFFAPSFLWPMGQITVVKDTENRPLNVAKPIELPAEVDIVLAEKFFRIAFGMRGSEGFESTSFLSPNLRTSQAQKLIALVDSYNNFSGPKVAEKLGQFAGRVSSIEFGREGSPVLYIHLPYWTHQRELSKSFKGEKISDEDNEKLLKEIQEVFVKQLSADEFGTMPYSKRVVRIWWD